MWAHVIDRTGRSWPVRDFTFTKALPGGPLDFLARRAPDTDVRGGVVQVYGAYGMCWEGRVWRSDVDEIYAIGNHALAGLLSHDRLFCDTRLTPYVPGVPRPTSPVPRVTVEEASLKITYPEGTAVTTNVTNARAGRHLAPTGFVGMAFDYDIPANFRLNPVAWRYGTTVEGIVPTLTGTGSVSASVSAHTYNGVYLFTSPTSSHTPTADQVIRVSNLRLYAQDGVEQPADPEDILRVLLDSHPMDTTDRVVEVSPADPVEPFIQDAEADTSALERLLRYVPWDYAWRPRWLERSRLVPWAWARENEPAYFLDASDPDLQQEVAGGLDLEPLGDRVVVRYSDPGGSARRLTYHVDTPHPALGGMEKEVSVSTNLTSEARAQTVAEMVAEEVSRDQLTGTIVTPYMWTIGGARCPIEHVEPGRLLRLLLPGGLKTDLRITAVEVGDDGLLRISMDYSALALDMELARAELRQT